MVPESSNSNVGHVGQGGTNGGLSHVGKRWDRDTYIQVRVPPSSPGRCPTSEARGSCPTLEYAVPEGRLHYAVPVGRLHYKVPRCK